MRQYIIRRLLIGSLVLFGVSIIIYTLVRLMPGDYVQTVTAGNLNMTPEIIENMRRLYGLDSNILTGYLRWLKGILTGDWGTSFMFMQPVTKVISQKLWVTLSIMLPTLILRFVIAIPLGIISATKQYSKTDYAITIFALIGISLPTFFFSAILQRTFAIGLKVVPLQGMVTARYNYTGLAKIKDIAWHFILPITALTITEIGANMRYVRTNMLEVLNADYIRTARAKGLDENTVVYRHAFRNTLVTIVTLAGVSIPLLFSGAMITEQIFAIDGMGYTAFRAFYAGDIPYIMAYTMLIAAFTVLGVLVSDVLYAVADPRVRLS